MASLLWLVRLAKSWMQRTSRSQRSRMEVDLGFFAFNHLELVLFEV
jgi:hypothetical protein